MRTLLAWLFVISFLNAPAAAQDAVSPGVSDPTVINPGDVLTLQRCIDIALKQHPSILAAEGTVNVSESRIGQARSGYFPQIGSSAAYTKINPVAGTPTSPFGIRPTYRTSSADITLNQTLFDFGKTGSSVDVQKYNLEASRKDFSKTINGVAFDVKKAFYDVLLAKKTLEVAREAITLYEKLLAQAQGFYQAGVKSKYDVTKATVDLSNAKLNEIKADNALKVARVTLNNAIGHPDAPAYEIDEKISFEKYEIIFQDALERAYQNRPDLLAVEARKEAAKESISRARKDYYPVLSGVASVNYGKVDEQLTSMDKGWTIGATLTFPLFSGFLTSNQVKEAKSSYYVQKATEEATRQAILLDVEQSYLSLKEAEQRIGTAELIVKQAQENLEIAAGRYKAGVGNPIEVTDAEVAYSNARTQFFQALRDYKVAQASIELAIGTR